MIMKFHRILVCAAALLAAVSCSVKISGDGSTEHGFVSFGVDNEGDIDLITKASLSDYTTLPAASDFAIVVKNSDNAAVYEGTVKDWDSSKPLQVGNYNVTATYGEEGAEGFGKPYFTGSTGFAVTGGQTTSVSVPAKLGNSLVKIECSESFRNYFTDYSFTLKTGSGTEIAFPKDETRAAFIEAYKFTLSGSFTSQGGAEKTFTKDYNSIEANTCYTIKFDASNIGGLKVTVTFNDTVETVDCGDLELNE